MGFKTELYISGELSSLLMYMRDPLDDGSVTFPYSRFVLRIWTSPDNGDYLFVRLDYCPEEDDGKLPKSPMYCLKNTKDDAQFLSGTILDTIRLKVSLPVVMGYNDG